jgi:DNA polymerase-1
MSRQTLFDFARPAGYTEWKPPNPPELNEGEAIGLDFEYRPGANPTKDQPFAVGVYSPGRKRSWYLPWAHEAGGNLPKEVVLRWLDRELRGRHYYAVNAKAEVHQLRNLGIDPDLSHPHDVVFNAALLNENRYSGFSLEALCVEYLPEHERKVHPTTVGPEHFYLAHAGEVHERCEADARQHWLLHEAMAAQTKAEELTKVLDLEDRCVLPTVEMERNGAIIDRSKLEEWVPKVDDLVSRLFMETYREMGLPVNPNNPKEMQRLFDQLGLQKPTAWDEETRGEKESWSEEALDTIKHPTVRRVALLKKWMSMKAKYFDKYLKAIDRDNVLRFNLHQLRADEQGTVTGRYSCGGGKHAVNVQQVPKAEAQVEELGPEFVVRELFIPANGKLCGASDASQIEFRLFAHFARATKVIEAYAENPHTDFHQMVAELFQMVRREAKHQNFAKIYGLGRPKLARKVGLPCHCVVDWEEQNDYGKRVRWFGNNQYHDEGCLARKANDMADEYDRRFPEAKKIMETAIKVARERGYIKTILGRRRRFPDGKRLHSSVASIMQGNAADVFKIKLWEAYCQRKTLGVTMRMPVHDELVYDLEPGKTGIAELLDLQSIPLSVPLLWDTKFGKNWMEANDA